MTKEEEKDKDFLINTIFSIRDYAIENNLEADDAIRAVAENMLALLEIATFNAKK